MVCVEAEEEDEGGVLTTPSASDEPLELADGLDGQVPALLCTVALVVKVLPAVAMVVAAAGVDSAGGTLPTGLGLLHDDTISIGCWGCVMDTVIALWCGTLVLRGVEGGAGVGAGDLELSPPRCW